MNKLETILVDIDPTVGRDHAVDRALMLAQYSNAKLELFINNSKPTGTEEAILENLQKELTKLQITVDIDFRTEKNLSEAVVAKVLEVNPDLVLKSTHGHDSLKYTFITNSDWKLIRTCPAPLLMVKPSAWHYNGGVVAAVDPLHPKADQSNLDHELVSCAEYFEEAFNQVARVFHCYYPVSDAMHPNNSKLIEELRAVKKLLSSHNIDPENVAIVRGDLKTELIDYIKSASINILVIGALSRTRIENYIVGSTAEKILDNAPCDILILKPAD